MGGAVAETELSGSLLSRAGPRAIQALVPSGVSARSSIHSADFKEAEGRMGGLVPPFLWRPRPSHVLYRSHQKALGFNGSSFLRAGPSRPEGTASLSGLFGKDTHRQVGPGQAGGPDPGWDYGASKSFLVLSAPF